MRARTTLALFGAGVVGGIAVMLTFVPRQKVEPLMLTMGTQEPCVATVYAETWQAMNEMKIYQWVTACEEMEQRR